MKVITKKQNIFQNLQPVKIKLLKRLSQIDPGYLEFPDEDKDIGSIMELENVMGDIYLNQSGITFISDNSEIILEEGVDFEFI
jgi:hypothetical protein